MKIRIFASAITFLCLISISVESQVFTVPPRLENESLDDKSGVPEFEQPNPITVPQIDNQEFLDAPEIITVRSINFSGNTLISDEEIEAAIAPYEGTTIPIDKLEEVWQIINDLYFQQGYEGSGAIGTDESFLDGDQLDLKLQIIEARIDEISIEGAGRLESYAKNQLRSLEGEFLQRDKLFNELRFLLDDERFSQLTLATLDKSQLDLKKVRIDLETEDPFKGVLVLNNGRSPSIGSVERGLSARYGNLVGIGDQFSIDYRNTDGSNLLGIGYDIPINGSGGQIELNYLYANAKDISKFFRDLNLRSKTQIFSVGYSQPILRQSSDNHFQEIRLGIRASRTENEDSSIPFLGTVFPLSDGANDNGRIRSTRLDLTQIFSRRTRQNTLSFASEFSFGIDLGNVNDASFGSGEFFRWTGSGLYLQRLTKQISSRTNFKVQLADRDLISNEQFTLGGRDSVRGFVSNQFARSNGLNLTQEFRLKVLDKNENYINLFNFLDFASGWNNQPQVPENVESMASIGVGIEYESDRFRATIAYGIPIFGTESQSRSLQADGLLMSLQFSF